MLIPPLRASNAPNAGVFNRDKARARVRGQRSRSGRAGRHGAKRLEDDSKAKKTACPGVSVDIVN
ncbi:hypothetical protein GCM10011335_21730 [Aureimonas glaciei]|uniref:Uncharacterized protein n=1 Tax=Aureimonas glaciei TaxID=1776957 RepID=A0A916XX83_9HYPH|nr:hypothetical protein GCM10011335_21730 [Aureimonas glaciei]